MLPEWHLCFAQHLKMPLSMALKTSIPDCCEHLCLIQIAMDSLNCQTQSMKSCHTNPVDAHVETLHGGKSSCILRYMCACSTYSPVLPGSGRWWLDLVLSLLFAADYVHRTLVCVNPRECTQARRGWLHQTQICSRLQACSDSNETMCLTAPGRPLIPCPYT